MAEQLDGEHVGLLDVRNTRLLGADRCDPGLAPLLEGEALSFCRMYESV
ncbi:MAG: hypothetical protein NTW86_30075 [Candidatus Sumerlaeota bacterium]|nr:hypothetical protein [Candidatus Sumerlaeota bacterium]